MGNARVVQRIWTGKPTTEGAGVRLSRVFGFEKVGLMDPFLLLDHFGSADTRDYIAGFPWHPHRGMETVTYMINGEVEHGDSLGNQGFIASGDIQWMTAGSGIIHQEMPQPFEGIMRGLQLWVNLPSEHKMMRPRYRNVSAGSIAEVEFGGMTMKIICGEFAGTKGPVEDLVVDVSYLDIMAPPFGAYNIRINERHRAFVYILEGKGFFDSVFSEPVRGGNLAMFGPGDDIVFSTEDSPMRFILVTGLPLGEPIAWRGPIAMNTQEQLDLAFQEYRQGSFIKQNAY